MRDLNDVITPLSTLEKLQAALLKVKELQQQIGRMEMQISTQADTIKQLRETRDDLTKLCLKAFTVVEFAAGEGFMLERPFYDPDDLLLEIASYLEVEDSYSARTRAGG